ncbi:PilZ domain-containing protein, partial [Pseudomonas sp. NBRC 111142]
MNTAVNVNVVHESEAQRQHARVRIPAKLRYLDSERQPQDVKVDDLSAGGLSFHAKKALPVGDVVRGRLQFVVDNLGLSMDIEFLVRSSDPQSGRTGVEFQ